MGRQLIPSKLVTIFVMNKAENTFYSVEIRLSADDGGQTKFRLHWQPGRLLAEQKGALLSHLTQTSILLKPDLLTKRFFLRAEKPQTLELNSRSSTV